MASKTSMVEFLATKGIPMDEDSPHLENVATSLGFLVHDARICYNVPKKGEVDKPTDNSKTYLAVTGGARGREAWFPVKGDPKSHVEAMIAGLEELRDKLAE